MRAEVKLLTNGYQLIINRITLPDVLVQELPEVYGICGWLAVVRKYPTSSLIMVDEATMHTLMRGFIKNATPKTPVRLRINQLLKQYQTYVELTLCTTKPIQILL